MGISNFFLFILLSVSFKAFMVICQNKNCDENDLTGLNGFKNCLGTEIDGWDSLHGECCSWKGITCDDSSGFTGGVIAVDLGGRGLKGEICEALADLDHLRFLNLSHNGLRGFIPGVLFHMQKMEVLDLSYNEFVGSFPVNTSLPVLRSFDLSNNELGDYLRVSICTNSPNIQSINLANNNFVGEVPENLGNCTSLLQLFLNGNSLSGRLPDSFFQLHNLKELYLQENFFNGTWDERVSNLSNIVRLDISTNVFSGFLPDVFMGFLKLESFSARSNQFIGQLPSSLVNSSSITMIDLGKNSLTGPISFNCSAMPHLSYLDLGSNHFDGPIAESLSTCQKLKILNLARNNLTGELPAGFQNLQALKVLSLSNVSLGNISKALHILQHCQNLAMLSLPLNFWNEEIPSDTTIRFTSLEILLLGNCGLTGSIPLWLRGSTSLQMVDLAWNKLSGKIPSWFGELSSVFFLNLSNNSLSGEIPKSLTGLRNLVNVSIVSAEDFFATLPLTYAFGRQRQRHFLQYRNPWSFPPTLDLSHNQLSGPVWPGFGYLASLHVLRLNRNNLSGSIPESLSGMVSLEVLDLSDNFLSAEIPSSLVSLHFLREFDVSCNRLSEKIPLQGQFATFPISSYQGNENLCGEPIIPCTPRTDTPSIVGEPATEGIGHFISMDAAMISFCIGASIGFIITVHYCFLSGWVFQTGYKVWRCDHAC